MDWIVKYTITENVSSAAFSTKILIWNEQNLSILTYIYEN
jgi:hypothetical protein